jgi:mannosyl-3-phosphoglycerate phosphatase
MLIIFSDLDGTLLDSTYHYDAAIPALEAAEAHGVPVILSSSKTRAEIESLRAAMRNTHPFIPENGGAAVIPPNYFPFTAQTVQFGAAYPELTAALQRASESSGVAVRGFSQMPPDELAKETGLSVTQARLASQREYDEPFLIPGEDDAPKLLRAIEAEGFRWTRGGRFFHILGQSDKAEAARVIRDYYRRMHGDVTTVALGDALNDAELLRFADIPVIVQSPQMELLAATIPKARITNGSGPAGWNKAVLDILHERTD